MLSLKRIEHIQGNWFSFTWKSLVIDDDDRWTPLLVMMINNYHRLAIDDSVVDCSTHACVVELVGVFCCCYHLSLMMMMVITTVLSSEC